MKGQLGSEKRRDWDLTVGKTTLGNVHLIEFYIL